MSKCPFHHLWKNSEPAEPQLADITAADGAKVRQEAVQELGCPFAAEARAEAGATPGSAPEPAQAQPASSGCPLGFGSSQGPKLSKFHCPLCRCLYYDCVTTNCGHKYCRACIAPFRDCPTCGADITGVTADAVTQDLVEQFIEAHAHTHTLWELESTNGSAPGSTAVPSALAAAAPGSQQQQQQPGEERSRSAFLLHLGLRAMAAGNAVSALHRLAQAAQELERQLDQGGQQEEQAALRCRLGTAYGCMGDCCRGTGDTAAALRHYQQSVAQLELAGEMPEALEGMAVSQNKIGELHHMDHNLPAAAEHYGRALALRRRVLAGLQCSNGDSEAAHVAAVLNVASSVIKLADAEQGVADASGALRGGDGVSSAQAEGEAPQALLQEAAQLLAGVQGSIKRQPAPLQRKFEVLLQFVTPEAAQ